MADDARPFVQYPGRTDGGFGITGEVIDEALDRLAAAMTGAEVPLWHVPESHAPLAELERAIAPMRLPEEVRTFWRRVDADTLRAWPHPAFTTPELALAFWRIARDQSAGLQPLALVAVGSEGQTCMSVELAVGDVDGGALFDWYVADIGGFTRMFNRLSDWVHYVAALIEQGAYVRRDSDGGPGLLIPGPAVQDAERPKPPEPGPDPVHGTSRYIGRDILDWPEHWQRANGLRAEDLELRGATHTVADLLALTPDVPLCATIGARVMSLADSGAWTRVRVDDGSGQLDVSCPYRTTLLGPTLGRWYEFDIVLPAGKVRTPPDPEAAAAGIEDPVEQLAAEYLARYGGKAGAIAQAVRRMPEPT
jgi:hypothetical protein